LSTKAWSKGRGSNFWIKTAETYLLERLSVAGVVAFEEH
jgi:hypothetical protein